MGWVTFLCDTAAQASDSDISCKYLLGAMATALVGTNSFWALWIRAVFKEKDEINNARISDLRSANMKIETD